MLQNHRETFQQCTDAFLILHDRKVSVKSQNKIIVLCVIDGMQWAVGLSGGEAAEHLEQQAQLRQRLEGLLNLLCDRVRQVRHQRRQP